MRSLILLLAAGVLTAADKPAFAVVEKVAGEVGFYTAEGHRISGVKVGTHPHEIVLSPDKRHAYVSDNGILWMTYAGEGGNTISVIDLEARSKVDVISLGEYRRPHGMDIDKRTGNLVITVENPDGLLLVDPRQGRVLRKYDIQGEDPHMVLLDAKGEWAYVSNVGTSELAAVHLSSGQVKLMPVDARPQGAIFSPDGKLIYLTCSDGNSIVVLDAVRHKRLGTIKTGKGPGRVALAPDLRTLVYNLQPGEAVGFADLEAQREVAQVPLGAKPLSLTLSADGSLAFVGLQEVDKIAVISVPEKKVLRMLDTPQGAGPDPVLPLP